jgi:hypothetical protein
MHASAMASFGPQYVDLGTAFFDLDNDGWEDVVIACGHTTATSFALCRALCLTGHLLSGQQFGQGSSSPVIGQA